MLHKNGITSICKCWLFLQTWLSHSMAVINHEDVAFQRAKHTRLWLQTHEQFENNYYASYDWSMPNATIPSFKSERADKTPHPKVNAIETHLKRDLDYGGGLKQARLVACRSTRKQVTRLLCIPVRSPLLRESWLVSFFALRLLICLNSARCLA